MKPKILYVEDETNLGRIVSEALETRGFEVMVEGHRLDAQGLGQVAHREVR